MNLNTNNYHAIESKRRKSHEAYVFIVDLPTFRMTLRDSFCASKVLTAWLTIRRGVGGGGDAWIHVHLLGGGVVVRGRRAALDALSRLQLDFQRWRSTDAVLVNPVVHTDSLFLLDFLILAVQYASVQCSCQPAQHTNNHIGKVSSKLSRSIFHLHRP